MIQAQLSLFPSFQFSRIYAFSNDTILSSEVLQSTNLSYRFYTPWAFTVTFPFLLLCRRLSRFYERPFLLDSNQYAVSVRDIPLFLWFPFLFLSPLLPLLLQTPNEYVNFHFCRPSLVTFQSKLRVNMLFLQLPLGPLYFISLVQVYVLILLCFKPFIPCDHLPSK